MNAFARVENDLDEMEAIQDKNSLKIVPYPELYSVVIRFFTKFTSSLSSESGSLQPKLQVRNASIQ
jgi:hypothetical protein